MSAEEFLEYQYGITLGEEKMLIHPVMLVKAMEEYANQPKKKCNTFMANPSPTNLTCRFCGKHQWYH